MEIFHLFEERKQKIQIDFDKQKVKSLNYLKFVKIIETDNLVELIAYGGKAENFHHRKENS